MNQWVEQEFATADLGDKRLNERMKLIIQRLTETPMLSIKSAFRGWAEVMAAYRFFNNSKTSIETVLAPHRDATLLRVKEHKRVLVIQDTSELDYTMKKALEGTGPLSTVARQGFFAHNHLVVTPERLPLGVWDTDIYARDEKEHGKAKERKQKPIKEKESYRWVGGYSDACVLAKAAPDTEVISCSDREGDIYEVFTEWHQRLAKGEKVAEWLIRCSQNRRLSKAKSDGKDPVVENYTKILEQVGASVVLGTKTVFITAQEQYKKDKKGNRKKVKRSARAVNLEVRSTTVTLQPPYRKHNKLPVLSFQVVMCTEKDPPDNEEPVEWVLLTSLPVADFNAADEIIELYMARWEIEVFHRVLKTGCKVEELQLKNDARAKVAIALYMVVAWRILYVMKLGRECPDLPCDVVFEEDEWQSLYCICYGEKALKTVPPLGEFVSKVAEFGGFLARKADGLPGPQAIWQGMARMRDFTLAWQIYVKGRPPLYQDE